MSATSPTRPRHAPASVRKARRWLAVGAAAAVAVTGLAASPAQAVPISPDPSTPTVVFRPAEHRIRTMLDDRVTTARFGTSFTGAVVDAATGRVVWTRNGTTGLMPASTTKLVTATAALRVFDASHRFVTTVKRGPWSDQVILVGSGDPSFSSAQVAALAATTASAMKASGRTTVRVYADDYLFPAPSLATGWKSSYVPADTTWLRALVVDGRQNADTSIDAARLFAAELTANGLTVAKVGRGRAAVDAPVLATSAGATVGQIVTPMLLDSDNEHAEALHRLVSIRTGHGNTWEQAQAAQTAVLTTERLSATALHDGSGLSRSGRLSGLQLARIMANAFEPGNTTRLSLLRSEKGLPVSGRTGTLKASIGRFTTTESTCAVGRVHAKTGTLSDAVALAGWTVGGDGQVKTFAFVVNGKDASLSLKQGLDMLAATVTGCY
ncbi:D-alanyl-D-alanine carboxypeptidase/D-alanyl-D-alanine-endopeptidase [Pedococcus aerophilus]|uniref:D-alanyl-D-alanine carboxypeptidase/D-alanyl-D-alanine-endopeptidase n=1 Tax=Pedococcus aerophilus TaxID=436356 RepID=UPI0031D5E896